MANYLAALRSPLRPFNADERVNNPDGSYSTERTMTVQMPDGWGIVPSLWMSPRGPVDLSSMGENYLAAIAQGYEQSNGTAFPRFPDVQSAEDWAVNRSHGGGAGQGPLQKRDRQR
jgi:hypothetical protein